MSQAPGEAARTVAGVGRSDSCLRLRRQRLAESACLAAAEGSMGRGVTDSPGTIARTAMGATGAGQWPKNSQAKRTPKARAARMIAPRQVDR